MFAEPSSVGQRHQTLLAAALLLAPMVKSGHLDPAGCVGVLSDAMEAGGRCPNDGEVDAALSGAVRFATAYEPPTHGAEFAGVAVGPAPPSGDAESPGTRELTEDAAALAFAVVYGDRFRFDTSAGGEAGTAGGAWFVYQDGVGWARDTVGTIHNTARDFVRRERETRGFAPDTKGAATVGFAGGVVRFARYDPRLVSTATQWDSDPWRLGVPGGSVDLRTGAFTQAVPSTLIRRRATIAPADTQDCPTWFGFLDAATAGDRDLQAWLQRLAGYMLTGDTSEEVFAFVYGPGGNGKGTFLAALEAILGEYAYKAPTELFKAEGRIPKEYQLAKLEGARAVFASETERGAFMAEGFVKEVTGNEGALNARHPYGSPFTFKPTFKLVIVGNHAPRLAGRTDAMERRMRVVPFNVKPPRPDPTLKARLVDEYPGILRWAIDGCMAWQRSRLGMCQAVASASDAYFAEQDSVALWAADCCVFDPNAKFPASAALQSFNSWLRDRGEKNTDSKGFKEAALRLPGVTWGHAKTGKVALGIGPISDSKVTHDIG
jgi:putative DNA primase/helicase